MHRTILVAAAVLVAAGCSDNSTGPETMITAEMKADVATATGEAVAGNVESMSRTEATANSSLFAFAGEFDPSGCTLTLGSLVCAHTMGNLDGEATITFRDAASTPQDAYDATTTASVDIVADVSGTVAHANYSITFARTTDLTVTGLAGSEASRTWNGSASTSVTASLFNGNRGYDLNASTGFESVVVPTSGSDPRWPTSGTATTQIEFSVTDGPNAGQTGSLTATVEFNGTGTVPLRIGGSDFTLDLASHTVSEAQ